MALSAFHTFCHRAGRGQFPELADRDDLWRLLAVITARKAVAVVRIGPARSAGRGSSASRPCWRARGREEGLARFLGREPSPELAAQLAEDYERLMDALGSHRSGSSPG